MDEKYMPIFKINLSLKVAKKKILMSLKNIIKKIFGFLNI